MTHCIGPNGEAAVKYASQRNWFVLPVWGVHPDGSCRCGKSHLNRDGTPDGEAGKHPHRLVRNGSRDASRDSGRVRWWWRQDPTCNIGVLPYPNHIVLDVDPRNGGRTSLRALTDLVGPISTLTTLSGGGGQHYWFWTDPVDFTWIDGVYVDSDKPPVNSGVLGNGLDIQVRRYVVAPPSGHASGSTYRWLVPDADIAPAPKWLLNWPKTRTELDRAIRGEMAR